MVLSRRTTILSVVVGALALIPTLASAQQDRAQFRERFEQMMKERLGTTDDEWKVLQPKIEKVQTAQRNSRGGFGGFGGRGGGGGGGGGGNRDRGADSENASPVQKAQRELSTALENKDTPAEEISKKLTALREAREKGRAELAAAQKELKEVLTARQEAVLVTFGMLD